jgi:opacity protein-like surface antigen
MEDNMNRLFLVLATLFALPLLAQAQESPRTEVFGGYSYMRADADAAGGDQDLNGFNASFTYNFNSFLGATAEFSGLFANVQAATVVGGVPTTTTANLNNYYFLFGPKFAFRGNGRFTPFAHVLLGAVTQDLSLNNGTSVPNNTQFAMAIGGGLDINFTEKISVRGAQVDYIMTRVVPNTNQNNLRASTGLVLKLGVQ